MRGHLYTLIRSANDSSRTSGRSGTRTLATNGQPGAPAFQPHTPPARSWSVPIAQPISAATSCAIPALFLRPNRATAYPRRIQPECRPAYGTCASWRSTWLHPDQPGDGLWPFHAEKSRGHAEEGRAPTPVLELLQVAFDRCVGESR